MSVESFRGKLKALGTVLDAYQAFLEAFRKLPPQWAEEALKELGIKNPLPAVEGEEVGYDGDDEEAESDGEEAASLPGPSDAVLTLLRDNPEGLTSIEIITQLEGRIKTRSPNPRKLLSSVLVALKRKEQIELGSDNRYRVNDEVGFD